MGGFFIFEPPFISIVIDGRPSCEIPPAFFLDKQAKFYLQSKSTKPPTC